MLMAGSGSEEKMAGRIGRRRTSRGSRADSGGRAISGSRDGRVGHDGWPQVGTRLESRHEVDQEAFQERRPSPGPAEQFEGSARGPRNESSMLAQPHTRSNGAATNVGASPLIPATHFIPFPLNVGWFVHYVKEHIYEEDEDRTLVWRAAMMHVVDTVVADVVAEELWPACEEAHDAVMKAAASRVLRALEHEVVTDLARTEAQHAARAKKLDACARHMRDVLLYEVCRELVKEALAHELVEARERAVSRVADDLLNQAVDDVVVGECEQAWDDAQPKNSFEMLSLDPNRTRKKPC